MSCGDCRTRKVPRASIRYSAGNGKAESLTEGSPLDRACALRRLTVAGKGKTGTEILDAPGFLWFESFHSAKISQRGQALEYSRVRRELTEFTVSNITHIG